MQYHQKHSPQVPSRQSPTSLYTQYFCKYRIQAKWYTIGKLCLLFFCLWFTWFFWSDTSFALVWYLSTDVEISTSPTNLWIQKKSFSFNIYAEVFSVVRLQKFLCKWLFHQSLKWFHSHLDPQSLLIIHLLLSIDFSACFSCNFLLPQDVCSMCLLWIKVNIQYYLYLS